MKTIKASVSQKRLRALARHSLRVIARHPSDVGLKVVAASLVPTAQAYIKVYDEGIKYQATLTKEMKQGREGLVALEVLLKSSIAILRRAVPGFDRGDLIAGAETPSRLLANAHCVVELLTHADHPVPERHGLLDALKAALDQGERNWEETQAAQVRLQGKQANVREHAMRLNRELVTLRRILRAVVGRSHDDYVMLHATQHPEMEAEVTDTEAVETHGVSQLVTTVATSKLGAVSNGANNTAQGASP